MCSDRHILQTFLASEFCTCCSFCRFCPDMPHITELHAVTNSTILQTCPWAWIWKLDDLLIASTPSPNNVSLMVTPRLRILLFVWMRRVPIATDDILPPVCCCELVLMTMASVFSGFSDNPFNSSHRCAAWNHLSKVDLALHHYWWVHSTVVCHRYTVLYSYRWSCNLCNQHHT